MNKRIKKIRQTIQEEFEETDWNYHILLVVKYAKKLGKIYEADEEVVELAALLHDIGRTNLKENEGHHIGGSSKARKILEDLNYSENIIKQVLHCIESHRAEKGPKPKTIIAKIIANADAMAHFDALPVFFYWRGRRGDRFEDILKWSAKKIEKDWNKKITLPEARKMVKKKYRAAKLLLGTLKN